MRILQVIGGHAVGKSSLLQALALGPDTELVESVDPLLAQAPKKKKTLTVNPRHRLVVIGDYSAGVRSPGVDAWFGVDEAQLRAVLGAARSEAVRRFPTVGWIAWEGIVIMTRPWHDRLQVCGLQPCYAHVTVPLTVSVERIWQRSGHTMADLKTGEKRLTGRARTAAVVAAYYRARGAPVLELDGTRPVAENTRRIVHHVVAFGYKTGEEEVQT